MIKFYCLALLLAICGQVELFKLGLLAQPQPTDQQAGEYYYPAPTMRQQQYGYQHQQIYAPGPQQVAAYQPYQPPALAYVIVRPIAPSYPYYDSSVRYWAPLQQPITQQADLSGVKGGLSASSSSYEQAPILASSTKGGARPEYVKQEKLQDDLPLEQPVNQPPPSQHMEQLYDMGKGKLLKIKSSFDKFAASAKSKLSLGASSYYVSGEEIVPPAAPPQPLHQEQLPASDLQLTKLEQQRVEEAGQTKLESQQQQLEDTRQATKLSEQENRGTKLPAEGVRQPTKLEEAPISQQVKFPEVAHQEQLNFEQHQQQQAEQPRETKGLSQQPLQQQQQLPLQQERYTEGKGQQQLFQQQREEPQQQPLQSQEALKSEPRDHQLRSFNGQQPTAYATGPIDADGFGKRHSAL